MGLLRFHQGAVSSLHCDTMAVCRSSRFLSMVNVKSTTYLNRLSRRTWPVNFLIVIFWTYHFSFSDLILSYCVMTQDLILSYCDQRDRMLSLSSYLFISPIQIWYLPWIFPLHSFSSSPHCARLRSPFHFPLHVFTTCHASLPFHGCSATPHV
jgi:hypothetical protein